MLLPLYLSAHRNGEVEWSRWVPLEAGTTIPIAQLGKQQTQSYSYQGMEWRQATLPLDFDILSI